MPPWIKEAQKAVLEKEHRSEAFRALFRHRGNLFEPAMRRYLSDPQASAEEVDLLVRHLGADVNGKTSNGTPFLLEALDKNHPRAFKWLIHQPGIRLDVKDRRGRTPFLAAVIQGRLPVLQALASQRLKVDLNGEEGKTALDWAANRCDGEMLSYLLDWWGDNLSGNFRNRWWDCLQKNQLTVKRYKRLSEHVRPRSIRDEIIHYGRPTMIQAMHGAGYSLNDGDPEHRGFTPMHIAAKAGRLDVVRTLLTAGVDLDRPALDGRTPLMTAALNGHPDVLKTLTDLGADVSRQDKDGETALIYVFRNPKELSFESCRAIVDHLLRTGADVNHQNKRGVSALHLAVDRAQGDVRPVLLLLKAGANVHATDDNRFTPLHYAMAAKDPARNRPVIALLEDSICGRTSAALR